MKTFEEFTQFDVAIMTASCIAFCASVPKDMPRWDGRNIDAFYAVKAEFSPTQSRYVEATDDPWYFPTDLDFGRQGEDELAARVFCGIPPCLPVGVDTHRRNIRKPTYKNRRHNWPS